MANIEAIDEKLESKKNISQNYRIIQTENTVLSIIETSDMIFLTNHCTFVQVGEGEHTEA